MQEYKYQNKMNLQNGQKKFIVFQEHQQTDQEDIECRPTHCYEQINMGSVYYFAYDLMARNNRLMGKCFLSKNKLPKNEYK